MKLIIPQRSADLALIPVADRIKRKGGLRLQVGVACFVSDGELEAIRLAGVPVVLQARKQYVVPAAVDQVVDPVQVIAQPETVKEDVPDPAVDLQQEGKRGRRGRKHQPQQEGQEVQTGEGPDPE